MPNDVTEQPGSPVAAPAETAVQTPAVETMPAADTGAPAAVETSVEPKAPEEFKPHTETGTLLEDMGGKAEGKSSEESKEDGGAKDEGEKPPAEVKAEEGKTDTPESERAEAEPLIYDDFKMPEGLKVNPDQLKTFTDIIGKHRLPQESAQELMNLHVQAFHDYAESESRRQHEAFGAMRARWRNDVMSDDELGGAGHQTAMRAVARGRDLLVPADRREAFDQALRVTGSGDHPEILRIFLRAARLFDEPAMPQIQGKPTAGNGKPPGRGTLRDIYKPMGS